MATALTTEGYDLLFRHLFGETATTFPSGCWLSLHSAQPTVTGTSQVSATRVAVSWNWDSTNQWYTNSAAVALGSVSASTISWIALWHGAGTGNVWFEGQLAVPLVLSPGGSVIIPAGTLRVYATPPDGTHKGGVADKGAELVLGHFLGISSWTMPTSFSLRCHSADPTRTGNVSVSYTYPTPVSRGMEGPFGDLWRGQDVMSSGNSTRYWSSACSAGTLVYGDATSAAKAFCDVTAGGSGLGDNGVDVGGVSDYTTSLPPRTLGYSGLRISLDVLAGVVSGDVYSSTATSAMAMTGTLTSSLLSGTMTSSMSMLGLISVGSTSVARGTSLMTMSSQIGDSASGVGFAVEGLLYETLVSLQIL